MWPKWIRILLVLVVLFILVLGIFYWKTSHPPVGRLSSVGKVSASDVPARLRYEPAGPEYQDLLEKSGGPYFSYEENLETRKLPREARNGRFGRIMLGNVTPLLFVTYRQETGNLFDKILSNRGKDEYTKAPNAIIFDLNGDQDLTNDPQFTGFSDRDPHSTETAADIDLQFPDGSTQKIALTLSADSLRTQIRYWLRGKVLLEGKEVDVAIINRSAGPQGLSQENNMRNAILLLDLNGNGEFEIKPFGYREGIGPEQFFLQEDVLIRGVRYEGQFDASRMELALARSTAPQGKLGFKPEFAVKIKSWEVFGIYGGPKTKGLSTYFSGMDREFPIPIKTEESLGLYADLFLEVESGEKFLVEFSKKGVSIQEGQTTTLQVSRIDSFDISLSQKDGQIVVTRQAQDENGIQYGRVERVSDSSPQTADPPDTRKSNGGRIAFQDVQGKQIGQGALEYG